MQLLNALVTGFVEPIGWAVWTFITFKLAVKTAKYQISEAIKDKVLG